MTESQNIFKLVKKTQFFLQVDELFMYLDESAVRVDTVIQAIEEKLQ